MKLQLSEIVEHADADQVLGALERYFRDESLEVVRDRDQLTVYGLGPSYRTMNRSDRTVARVTSNHTGTAVHVDSQFLASALMGEMSQDTVVRAKIERVFQRTRDHLCAGPPFAASLSEPIPSAPPIPAPTVPPAELEFQAVETAPKPVDASVVEQNSKPVQAPLTLEQTKVPLRELDKEPAKETSSIAGPINAPSERRASAAPVIAPSIKPPSHVRAEKEIPERKLVDPVPVSPVVASAATVSPVTPAATVVPEGAPTTQPSAEVLPETGKPIAVEAVPLHWTETAGASEEIEIPGTAPSFGLGDDITKRRSSSRLTFVIVIVLLIVVASYFVLRHSSAVKNFFVPGSGEHQISASTAPTASPATPSTDSSSTLPAPPSEGAAVASTEESPQDVKAWVKEWAAALRTRDAQSQVSFYAEPVDRYLLKSAVDKEQLLKDKQAEIAKRQGVWTVDAENVVISNETDSAAIVRLTKHITQEAPPGIVREWHIRTQLKLKRIDGNWKITAEQTL